MLGRVLHILGGDGAMDPRYDEAFDLFDLGLNKTQVALKLGITTRTLRRWMEDPQFALALKARTEGDTALHRLEVINTVHAIDQVARESTQLLHQVVLGRSHLSPIPWRRA